MIISQHTPIRLSRSDSEKVKDHLLSLSDSDRYRRFCSSMSDEAIKNYVNKLNFDHDTFFAIFCDSRIVGLLHLAHGKSSSEIALSVNEEFRRHGIGKALFERAVIYCKALGIKKVYITCLATNTAVKKMAKENHMEIISDSGESAATLDLTNQDAIEAWIKNAQYDTLALYDLGWRTAKLQWSEYISEIQKVMSRFVL